MREYDESARDTADDLPLAPNSTDRGGDSKLDVEQAPDGMGIRPPAIGGVTDRILEDLRSRPDNPVDQTLADLLAGTNRPVENVNDFNGESHSEPLSDETRGAESSAIDQDRQDFAGNSVDSTTSPAESSASNDFTYDRHEPEEDHHHIADKEHP